MHQGVLGHLVLDERQDRLGGAHRGRNAQQVEVLLVARVVHSCHHVLDPEVVAGHLPDDDVVLVVARDGDADIRAGHARGLEHEDLGAVPVPRDVLELALEGGEPRRAGLDDGHLVAHAQQRAAHVGPHLSPSDDDRVHQASSPSAVAKARRASDMRSIAVRVGHTVTSPRSS